MLGAWTSASGLSATEAQVVPMRNSSISFSSGDVICSDPSFVEIYSHKSPYIHEFDNNLKIKNGIIEIHEKFDNRKTQLGKFENQQEIRSELISRLTSSIESQRSFCFDLEFESDENGEIGIIQTSGILNEQDLESLKNPPPNNPMLSIKKAETNSHNMIRASCFTKRLISSTNPPNIKLVSPKIRGIPKSIT